MWLGWWGNRIVTQCWRVRTSFCTNLRLLTYVSFSVFRGLVFFFPLVVLVQCGSGCICWSCVRLACLSGSVDSSCLAADAQGAVVPTLRLSVWMAERRLGVFISVRSVSNKGGCGEAPAWGTHKPKIGSVLRGGTPAWEVGRMTSFTQQAPHRAPLRVLRALSEAVGLQE